MSVTDYMHPFWKATIESWKRDEFQCERCGIIYKEINNIGLWRCSQHTGEYVYDYDRDHYFWTCCNNRFYHKAIYNGGCTKADHIHGATNFSDLDDILIPNELKKLFTFPARAIVSNINTYTDSVLKRRLGFIRQFDNKPLNLKSFMIIRRYEQ